MGLTERPKGTRLHERGQKVENIEIILKGSVTQSIGDYSIRLSQGSLIGETEKPGEGYIYDYVVETDAVIYSYPYVNTDDIERVIETHQKIAPSLTSQTVKNAASLYDAYVRAMEGAKKTYALMRQEEKEYPILCQETGTKIREFSELASVEPPSEEQKVTRWRVEFIQTFLRNEDKFITGIYTLGSPMCTGVVLNAVELMNQVSLLFTDLYAYIEDYNKKTASFRIAMDDLKARQEGQSSGTDGEDTPPVNLLARLLEYSEADDELSGALRRQLKEYKSYPDRGDTSDELRALRRKLTDSFLRLYKAVFMNAQGEIEVPIEAKMFLMFGVLDEGLVDEEDYVVLFRYAKSYQPDPGGRILTAFEWLKKVFMLNVDPSRNEFDLDWQGYLKEAKVSGDITEAQAKAMFNDRAARLDFELKNLFAMGNRMTFGRISTYIPVFDSCNVLMPMDKAYINRIRIQEALDHIREVDINIFYREKTFSEPKLGINAMPIHEEVLPYIILMPNFGSRSMLWQEVEGKKRNSPARMLFPIFTTEELQDSMTRVCGEFRWEMCKTEQGIHWNDLSDPSLTSEYSDYLQYFRKNSGLNKEQKEKLKKDLQKYSNNYRRVFVSDYYTYMTYESKAALRMNKVAREIIFKYCPFGKSTRDLLGSNPQYTEHINRHNTKATQRAHPIEMLLKKLENNGEDSPEELVGEVEFLQR